MFTVFQKNVNRNLILGGLLGALLTLPAYAAQVPIEQRSLSNTGNANAVGANPAENSQGSTLWQLYQQVQQLQQEVRELRGQLEDQQDTIGRTQKDLKNRYADLDQRVELLNQAQNQDGSTEATEGTENSANPASESSPEASQPEKTLTPVQVPENGSPAPAKSASAPANSPSVAKAPASSTPTPVSAPTLATAEKDAYVGAYDAYKTGGAAKAIRPMQGFIASYPNSVYVPNAHYWLGEFYLASDPVDFVKAKQSFLIVVSKYPKSAKASTSLYRLATITKEIDHRPQDAMTLMRKVIQDYPTSQEASFAKSFINSN